MYINIPNRLDKRDIHYLGKVFKDNTYSLRLSDVSNTDDKNTIKLGGYGFYDNMISILDTYLFVVGNQIKTKWVDYRKIDYLEKILDFEYVLHNLKRYKSKVQLIKIPSKMFTITTNSSWLNRCIFEQIQGEVVKIPYLQDYEDKFERTMRYLCDNTECVGICEEGIVLNTLLDDYLYVYKDTSFDGFIIKYQHDRF